MLKFLRACYLSAILGAALVAPVCAQVGGGVTGGGSFNPPSCSQTGCASNTTPMLIGNVNANCNGAGSPSISGNMQAFRLVCGTTAITSISVTWPSPRASVPACNISGETVALATISANNTTTLTWTFASTASTVWDVNCWGM